MTRHERLLAICFLTLIGCAVTLPAIAASNTSPEMAAHLPWHVPDDAAKPDAAQETRVESPALPEGIIAEPSPVAPAPILAAEPVLPVLEEPEPVVLAAPEEAGEDAAATEAPISDPLILVATPQDEATRTQVQQHFITALVSTYESNPRLKAQREAVKVLDEGVSEAASSFRPFIEATYGKGRRRSRTGAPEWGYFDTETQGLTVDQPLFTGGEGMGNLKAARSRMKAGRAELRAVEQEVLLDAVMAYVDLAEAAAVRILSGNNVTVLGRQREVTFARFDAGELTRTDVTQADARLATAESDLQRAIGDMEAARATFERIIGYTPGVVLLPEISLPLPATLAEAQAQAIEAFPDLKQAQYFELAADDEIEARVGTLLPDVSLRGSISRAEGSAFPGANNFDTDSLTVNVSVPLYQSGAEYARLRAARKRYQQTRYQSASVKNLTVENVTRAWHNYKAAQAVIESSEAAVRAGEIALEGVKRESEFGERTTLDVLDAEQELFVSRVNLVRARRDRIVTAYALLAAAGRLNAESLELPVELYNPIAHYDHVKWLPAGF